MMRNSKAKASALTLAALGIVPALVPASVGAVENEAEPVSQLTVKLNLNLPAGAVYAGQFPEGTRPTGPTQNKVTAAELAAQASGPTPCGGFISRHWEPGVSQGIGSVTYFSSKAITDWTIGLCAVTAYRVALIRDVTGAGSGLGYSFDREELGPENRYMKWGPAGPQGAHHYKWSDVFGSYQPWVGDEHIGADVDVYGDGLGCYQMNGSSSRDCWWF